MPTPSEPPPDMSDEKKLEFRTQEDIARLMNELAEEMRNPKPKPEPELPPDTRTLEERVAALEKLVTR